MHTAIVAGDVIGVLVASITVREVAVSRSLTTVSVADASGRLVAVFSIDGVPLRVESDKSLLRIVALTAIGVVIWADPPFLMIDVKKNPQKQQLEINTTLIRNIKGWLLICLCIFSDIIFRSNCSLRLSTPLFYSAMVRTSSTSTS